MVAWGYVGAMEELSLKTNIPPNYIEVIIPLSLHSTIPLQTTPLSRLRMVPDYYVGQ